MNSDRVTPTSPAWPPGQLRSFLARQPRGGRPEVAAIIGRELGRQRDRIELIASENIASPAVLEATGSVLHQQVRRGLSGPPLLWRLASTPTRSRRWRSSAPRRCSGCQFANVQPNSGSQMNQAVFLALLTPGDTFMGLDLAAGGHLTHGSPVNMSGKWFQRGALRRAPEDQRLDMDAVRRLAHEHRPKLIIAGATAYPRHWDFAAFREIADEVGAYLLVDMSHFSGLVAGGAHPSPVPARARRHHDHAQEPARPALGRDPDDDEALAKKFNSAVFPACRAARWCT
jgi:glycine hydroxymethyltransferase